MPETNNTVTAVKPKLSQRDLEAFSDDSPVSPNVNLAHPGSNNTLAESSSTATTAAPQNPPLESHSQATGKEAFSKLEATPPPPPPKTPAPKAASGGGKNNKTGLLLIILTLGLLAAAGGFGWYWFNNQASDQTDVVEQDPQPVAEEPVQQPPTITVDELETESTTPTLTGTVSDPESEVVVTVNGVEYIATVNPNGSWSAKVTQSLAEDTVYEVTAKVTAEDGLTASDETEDELTILAAEEPEPVVEPEEEPIATPDTEPGLPATGPSGE